MYSLWYFLRFLIFSFHLCLIFLLILKDFSSNRNNSCHQNSLEYLKTSNPKDYQNIHKYNWPLLISLKDTLIYQFSIESQKNIRNQILILISIRTKDNLILIWHSQYVFFLSPNSTHTNCLKIFQHPCWMIRKTIDLKAISNLDSKIPFQFLT